LWEEDFVDDTSAFNSDSLQLSCPGLAYPGAGSESCKFDVIMSDFEAKKTMAGGYMGSGVKVRFMNGTMGPVWALISDWTTGSGLVPVRTCSNHFRNEERISTLEDFSYLLTRVCRTVPVRSSRVGYVAVGMGFQIVVAWQTFELRRPHQVVQPAAPALGINY